MPQYPASLPPLDQFSFLELSAQNAIIRTPMSAGPAKQRPRFTSAPRTLKAGANGLTGAQVESFQAFFEGDLAMGAISFEMVSPITGATRTFRFMSKPPIFKALGGGKYSVAVQLEQLP